MLFLKLQLTLFITLFVINFNNAAKCKQIYRCDDGTYCGFRYVWCSKQNGKMLTSANTNNNNSSIAEQMCQVYQLKKLNLVWPIIKGVKAKSKEFPHMASLGTIFRGLPKWFCGGSLISDLFVLTAAHCEKHWMYGKATRVRMGILNLEDDDDEHLEEFSVSKFIAHSQYQANDLYNNDIALIRLSRSVKFNDYIRPICLDTNPKLNYNTFPIATGWGQTETERTSKYLLKVMLNFFTIEECKKTYNFRVSYKLNENTQICAGSYNSRRDTCKGDSGGPLQVKYKNNYKLVGITSLGIECGLINVPALYTKVSPFVPWIEKIVWPNNNI